MDDLMTVTMDNNCGKRNKTAAPTQQSCSVVVTRIHQRGPVPCPSLVRVLVNCSPPKGLGTDLASSRSRFGGFPSHPILGVVLLLWALQMTDAARCWRALSMQKKIPLASGRRDGKKVERWRWKGSDRWVKYKVPRDSAKS